MNTTIDRILEEKIIMIARNIPKDKLPALAEALYRGGIRLMECTFDASGKTPDEEIAASIAALVKQFEGRMLIGAGTVLTEKQVRLTKEAGGRFIISPDVNEDVIKESGRCGLVSIPGALTPSEATAAHRAGADFIKLFPVGSLGAPYVKALCAPLSHLRFLAVGGVGLANARTFLDAGALGVGMSISAEDKDALARGDVAAIEARARALVEAVK